MSTTTELDPRVQARLDQVRRVAPSAVGIFKRAYAGSRKWALVAFCLECVGYIRPEVRRCPAVACPLHSIRPYQQSDDEAMPDTPDLGESNAATALPGAEGEGGSIL